MNKFEIKMNFLFLLVLLNLKMVSSTTEIKTKLKLMSAEQLRKVSLNQKEILRNDDIIISEYSQQTLHGQVFKYFTLNI